MDNIKTKTHLRDIKTFDRAAVLADKIRDSGLKIKTETLYDADDANNTPDIYAEEQTENAVNGIVSTSIYWRHKIGSRDNYLSSSDSFGTDDIRVSDIKSKELMIKRASDYRIQRKNAVNMEVNSNTLNRDKSNQIIAGRVKEKYGTSKVAGKSISANVKSTTASPAGTKSVSDKMRENVIKRHSKNTEIRKAQLKSAENKAKLARKASVKSLKALLRSLRSLTSILASVGFVVALILVTIITIAVVASSAFGVFFSADSGMTMYDAVTVLNKEIDDNIKILSDKNPHDEVRLPPNDGTGYIDWREVIAVYAVKVAEDENTPLSVINMDEDKLSILRTVMNDMTKIKHKVISETRELPADINKSGNADNASKAEETKSETIKVLIIDIICKDSFSVANSYKFTKSQTETLSKLLDPENDILWAELLGGFALEIGSGEPSPDRIPTGIFKWPLEVPGRITSYFGYRTDPFTGVKKYHSGIDLAVPTGTPILAAANGKVTVANSTDSWGGGYGYYVKIKHKDGYDTFYAHCSKIAVKRSTSVKQGQIIAYVGSTGRSTGPHLHFEIYENGKRIDPLLFFK